MAQGGFKLLRSGTVASITGTPEADYQATQTQPTALLKDLKTGTVEILVRAFDNAKAVKALSLTIQPIMVLRTDQGGAALIGGRPPLTGVTVGDIREVENVDCMAFGVRLTSPVTVDATLYEIWVRS